MGIAVRGNRSWVGDEVVSRSAARKPKAVAAEAVKEAVERHLGEVEALSQDQRLHQRSLRFRRFGEFEEWERVEGA